MTKLLLLVPLIALTISPVAATSNFPAGCAPGVAAVGGSHLQNGALMSTLQNAGYTFAVPATATVGEPFTVELMKGDNPFLGYLIRVEGADVEVTAPSDAASGPASVCDVASVGHTAPTVRDSVMVQFDPVEMGTLTVDVTVVESNQPSSSVFRYERFSIVVEDVAAPMEPEPTEPEPTEPETTEPETTDEPNSSGWTVTGTFGTAAIVMSVAALI